MAQAEGDRMKVGRPPNTERHERVRALVAQGLSAREIAPIIGLARRTIIGMVYDHKLGPWKSSSGTPRVAIYQIPDDFAEQFRNHTRLELRKMYGRSNTTITAWVNRLGLEKKRYNGVRATPAKHLPRTHNAWRPSLTGRQPVDRAHRDETPAGQAADYLRRFGPVIRCNAQGRYDQHGDHWLRGSTLLTADEVIDRAVRNGWRSSEALAA
jgi:transposase